MELGFSKSVVFLGICFACLSVLFYKKNSQEVCEDSQVNCILKSWDSVVQIPENQSKKLAIGINSNIDVIMSGVELLKALGMSPGKSKDHSVINNLGQLQESFSYFFSQGRAAERTFSDPAEYQTIIQAAESLNHVEYIVGGNAALMAKTASKLFPKIKIQFVGPVGPLLANLLPKTIDIPDACQLPRDEMHLIMEYKVGEKWGQAIAPVATRFITTYDEHNSKVSMIETFFESIKTSKPDLILLSGLHLLDGLSLEIFDDRLGKVIPLVKDVPATIPIHLELASMANEEYVQTVMEKVVPHVDSLGLNEQELAFSSKATDGPHSSESSVFGSNGQPEIHKVSDILLWLLQTFGRSSKSPNARLTRVHFHSLTYHIVAAVESSWANVASGVAAGTRMAGLQACDVSELNEELVEVKIPPRFKLYSGGEERDLDPLSPVIEWRVGGYLFVFSPVLVCKHPLRTVGLGDAISTTGLMYSAFLS